MAESTNEGSKASESVPVSRSEGGMALSEGGVASDSVSFSTNEGGVA